MFFTNDPVADAERYYAEKEAELNRLPVCDCCGDPIQDEYLYLIDNHKYCKACLDEHFRKDAEDYI